MGEEDSGFAAGLADNSFAVGTALGVAICGSLAAAGGAAPQRAAFATAGVFACLGLTAARTLLPGRRRPDSAIARHASRAANNA